MTLHSKSSLATLYRRRERILRAAEDYAPAVAALIAELRAIDLSIEQYNPGEDRRFASIRSTQKAVAECLRQSGTWMKKRDIANELLHGGFAMDPENGPRLVVDSISHSVERGKFVFRDGLVGLLEWGDPPSHTASRDAHP